MNKSPETVGEHASPAEAMAAIAALSSADFVKLEQLARFFSRRRLRGTVIDWEDLLQEAIVRTCQGERRWRRGVVSIVKHLDRVMESISSEAARQRALHHVRRTTENQLDESTRTTRDDEFDSSVEARAAAVDDWESLARLFDGDSQALRVLECRGRGMEGKEIQQALSISGKEFETIAKRVRRAIARYTGSKP